MRQQQREDREYEAMREAQREAERCEMFDDRDTYAPGARFW